MKKQSEPNSPAPHHYPLTGPLVERFAKFIDTPKFPLKDAAEISGVHPKRIQQWIHRGQLKTAYQTVGTGDQRKFTFNEIGHIAMLGQLSDSGVSVDVAVSAAAVLGQDVKRHLLQIASWLQSSEALIPKSDIISVNPTALCISTIGEPKIMGFAGTYPLSEVIEDMGECFFVIDSAKIINRVLEGHVKRFVDEIERDLKNVES
jgi:DNA-binding transcriptional MerR regulator